MLIYEEENYNYKLGFIFAEAKIYLFINRIKSRTKLNYWKTSGNDKLPIQKRKKKKRHTYKTITPISGNIRAIGS